MLKNYFLTALRTFKKSKMYTLINVSGLGLGIGCTIIIFSLIKYNFSFDNFHSDSSRIYRITTELNIGDKKLIPGVPDPLTNAFRADYPFAEKAVTVFNEENQLILVKGASDKKFEEKLAYTTPEFFEIFNFPFLKGSAQALSQPNSAIITEQIAKKYFGAEDPIGKVINIAGKINVTVTGIMQDLPINTDFREEIYLPLATLKQLQPWLLQNEWLNVNSNMQSYLKLKPDASAVTVNGVFPSFINKYYESKDAKQWKFHLQPLSDIHLNTELGALVSKQSMFALGCVGLFLILAACINFINLATAQAISKSKEIGVRKVLGGRRSQLFWQFLVETAVISFIALIVAMILTKAALPYVNELFNTQLDFNFLTDVYLIGFLTILLIFIIFSSGFYPGLVLGGIEPVLALKGKISHSSSGSMSLRKGLVITQFAISQLLIIGTIVIVNQMNYSQKADMGFEKDGIVIIPTPDNNSSKLNAIRAEMLKIPGVKNLSFCYAPPAQETANTTGISYGSKTELENFQISFRAADNNYTSLFNLKILAGRNVHPSDTVREFIVNQSTVKALGLKSNDEIIGNEAVINGYKGTIVGVMKDFHNKSFHSAIEPLALTTFSVWYSQCAVKIDADNMKNTLAQVERVWKEANPDKFYKQEFLDSRMARLYETDNRMMKLIQIFTFIAVFIGCLSLYGLVSFTTAQKKREVAVRKVLGASVKSIIFLFANDFGRLMLIAFTIAAPLSWWIMNNWLQNFAYRIDIGAGIFLLALLLTSVVVTLTVGYKSMQTALADPAKSLKSE